jgi:hypothetical protein
MAALCCVSGATLWAQDLTDRGPERDKNYMASLAAKSDLVIVAEVGHGASQWYRKSIVTIMPVTPLSVLKGDPPGRSIPVLFFGGTVGVINQDFTHEATLKEGEVAVLFLNGPPRSDASRALHTFQINGEDGKIPLLAPGQSKTRLQNNKRLVRFLDELKAAIAKEGPE